jgi:hypothetical protein
MWAVAHVWPCEASPRFYGLGATTLVASNPSIREEGFEQAGQCLGLVVVKHVPGR